MRYYPDDKYDNDELARLNAAPWQVEALRMNPSYCGWGPYEDYMADKKGAGWMSNVFSDSWEGFGPWKLDDLNEVVNFYFEIDRENKECPTCGGNGYHSLAQPIADGFYDFENRGVWWNDNITQDELDALWNAGRLGNHKKDATKPTLEEVNRANMRNGSGGFNYNHDGINRSILIRTRLTRFGLPVYCDMCEGHGIVYTAPAAQLNLVLWVIHPRKGASHANLIRNLTQADMPAVIEFLQGAARRNQDRFSKLKADFYEQSVTA